MQVESTCVATKTNRDHESANFWQQHISAFKQAKLSRRAYCRQQGLIYQRFNYWFNKLLPAQASVIKAIPITLKSAHHAQPLCTLQLGGSNQLIIHDQSVLNDILSRLL